MFPLTLALKDSVAAMPVKIMCGIFMVNMLVITSTPVPLERTSLCIYSSGIFSSIILTFLGVELE